MLPNTLYGVISIKSDLKVTIGELFNRRNGMRISQNDKQKIILDKILHA